MSAALTLSAVWPPAPVAGFDLAGRGDGEPDALASARTAVLTVARKWCVDRALCPETVRTVAALMGEAVAYGSRFAPQGLTMTIRWLDLDHMRIDLVWHGCTSRAVAAGVVGLEASERLFDRLADRWGVEAVGTADSRQWFDLDTRGPHMLRAPAEVNP